MSSATTIDLIVRSRPVILEILEARGYDIASYKDVSPVDIYTMASKKPSILTIKAKKSPDSAAPKDRVVVLYWTENKLYRQSAATILEKMYAKVDSLPEKPDEEEDEDNGEIVGGAGDTGDEDVNIDPRRDEIIILLSESFHEQYNQLALAAWSARKIRINFFALKNLISNPSKHFMVPPHRKLSPDEITEVLKNLHMRSVNEFPHIKFHFDMQARILGLVPGDVVEIQRPSETAGVYTFYRVCMP
jgi:DNA-directed RNA polymerase subunit H (RpoH/RPB5)